MKWKYKQNLLKVYPTNRSAKQAQETCKYHWTEQAEKVNPWRVSDQHPPLSIVHLAGPKAVKKEALHSKNACSINQNEWYIQIVKLN